MGQLIVEQICQHYIAPAREIRKKKKGNCVFHFEFCMRFIVKKLRTNFGH